MTYLLNVNLGASACPCRKLIYQPPSSTSRSVSTCIGAPSFSPSSSLVRDISLIIQCSDVINSMLRPKHQPPRLIPELCTSMMGGTRLGPSLEPSTLRAKRRQTTRSAFHPRRTYVSFPILILAGLEWMAKWPGKLPFPPCSELVQSPASDPKMFDGRLHLTHSFHRSFLCQVVDSSIMIWRSGQHYPIQFIAGLIACLCRKASAWGRARPSS